MVGENPVISSKQVKLKESRKPLNSFHISKQTCKKVPRTKFHPLNKTRQRPLYIDEHIYQENIN